MARDARKMGSLSPRLANAQTSTLVINDFISKYVKNSTISLNIHFIKPYSLYHY